MHIRIVKRNNKNKPPTQYIQLVRSVRIKGKKNPQQKIMASLGRLDQIKEGQFDALIKGLAELPTKLKLLDMDENLFMEDSFKLGPRLIVEHLWKKLNLPEILKSLNLTEAVVEPLFQMILARIDEPVSKRSTVQNLHWYLKPGEKPFSLSTFYRSLDEIVPHIPKIEERLFEAQHGPWEQDDFFNPVGLDLIFFDTTSVSVHQTGDDFFKRGYSRDHRPDLPQFLIGLVVSTSGDPLCHYLFPGNTSDKKAFEKAIHDVRRRFPIKRIIFLADRGYITESLLEGIRTMGLEYIVGCRLRLEKKVRETVLKTGGRYAKYDDVLKCKEVHLDSERYIVIQNAKQAERDRHVRQTLLSDLSKQAGKSLKGLTGNRGYRRYLKNTGTIEIDSTKVSQDERYDGKWVLRTNVKDMTRIDVIESYKTS